MTENIEKPNNTESEQPSAEQAGQPQSGAGLCVVAIDDEQGMLDYYKAVFARLGVRFASTTDPSQGLDLVERWDPDLTLLDLTMPGIDGIELLHRIRSWNPLSNVAMVTGDYTIETAVQAIREGASDYICKPIGLEKIQQLVDRARNLAARAERTKALERELTEVSTLGGIIGRSPRMLEVFDLIRRVAPHFRTALIQGETGTGKELAAQALFKLSPRSAKRFSVFNCSAIVETLAESQLFGHRKGAFTGATQDQLGLFEWADGGAVFLDEVGELSFQAQSKLLRVLETGDVQKLGSPVSRKVDVLVIAATSRDLREEVANGKFRPDLLYRLNMVQIEMPPLRDRRDDILLLANHFLERFKRQYAKDMGRISRAAQNALLVCSWPGNVRELENAIGRACMLARGRTIDIGDLPESVTTAPRHSMGPPVTLEEAEKAVLIDALAKTKNKAVAARILGTSRATLYRLIQKYGLGEDNP